MLNVMWRINYPWYPEYKLFVFPAKDQNSLDEHVSNIYRVYNEESARVVGVMQLEHRDIINYLQELKSQFKLMEHEIDIGKSKHSFGVFETRQEDIVTIILNRGFESIDIYLDN